MNTYIYIINRIYDKLRIHPLMFHMISEKPKVQILIYARNKNSSGFPLPIQKKERFIMSVAIGWII